MCWRCNIPATSTTTRSRMNHRRRALCSSRRACDFLVGQAFQPDSRVKKPSVFRHTCQAGKPDLPKNQTSEPKTTWSSESEFAFYRRKQNSIAVRHVSNDEVVAMVEVVSPGNKSGKKAVDR